MEEKKILNINLREIIRILHADRKKVGIYAIVAGVIGVALAFGTPKIYKSTVILAPEESGQGFSGSISSLASMVGMNMKIGQTGDALYPEIYPDLMSSTDFLVDLFPIKVQRDKTGEEYTYQDYMQNHQKEALISYPILGIKALVDLIKGDEETDSNHVVNPFRLTKKEHEVAKSISNNTICIISKTLT